MRDLIEESEDVSLKRKTLLLLGEILKLADCTLPSTISTGLQILPALMNGISEEEDEDIQPTSSNLVYQIDSVNRNLHKSTVSSKMVGLSSSQTMEVSNQLQPKSTESGRARIDMDEIQFRSLLVDTQVTSTVNYLKWKWDIILDIIEGPLLNPRRLEDAVKGTKFLKRLIGFYRPFKWRFPNIRNTKANQRYVRIGYALLRSLLQTSEGVQYLMDSKLILQLSECLAQVDRVSL